MDNHATQGADSGHEAEQPAFKRNRSEGYVIECNGNRAIIAATGGKSSTASQDYWDVYIFHNILCTSAGNFRMQG